MKNILFALMIAVAGLMASCDTTPAPLAAAENETAVCHYGQCTSIAKSTGVQCKNCAQKGTTKCYTHRD